jgi:protein-S-isoprenylcysteine O-methyltransferase Ste14
MDVNDWLRGDKKMGQVNLTALLHALSGAGAIIASSYTGTDWMASVWIIKPLGLTIFGIGMLLFVVAVAYLKKGFLGEVEPVTDNLVTTGPYRHVRHPIYLSMFIATIGLAIGFRSLWGMGFIFSIFLPVGIYRARREEEALARRFGKEWEDYARQTYFMLPPLY